MKVKNLSILPRLLILCIAAIMLCTACADRKFAMKYYDKAKAETPYDAIIVTGIPYDDSSNSGLIFLSRVLWAKYLYDQGIVKNIIFSGSAVSNKYYEGMAMKITADSLGLPSNHTFAEIRAEHSTENVWYGMRLAHKLGFKKIALAADPFQVKMLKGFLKKRCDNMPYIPIVYELVIKDRNHWQAQMPKVDLTGAIAPKYVRLSEREGFWQRWAGTRGKHINYDEKE